MIARVPQSARKLVLSSRLGLVSIAQARSVPGAASPEGQGFARAEARTLLRSLGRRRGLNVLEATPEEFPASLPEDPASLEGIAEEAGSDGAVAGSLDASQGDEAVRLALEGLDVVWMDGAGPVAAFVLEPGGGHWEGLRRLADLLALQPKLKAPLYAVTVPGLRTGLEEEVHRPVYRLLKKPLAEVLRLLEWARLRTEVDQLGERVRYLKPEFLEGIADRVEPPAAE